jgi:hypothetical protein
MTSKDKLRKQATYPKGDSTVRNTGTRKMPIEKKLK